MPTGANKYDRLPWVWTIRYRTVLNPVYDMTFGHYMIMYVYQ